MTTKTANVFARLTFEEYENLVKILDQKGMTFQQLVQRIARMNIEI